MAGRHPERGRGRGRGEGGEKEKEEEEVAELESALSGFWRGMHANVGSVTLATLTCDRIRPLQLTLTLNSCASERPYSTLTLLAPLWRAPRGVSALFLT